MKTLVLGSLLALAFGAVTGLGLRAGPLIAPSYTGPRTVVAEALHPVSGLAIGGISLTR